MRQKVLSKKERRKKLLKHKSMIREHVWNVTELLLNKNAHKTGSIYKWIDIYLNDLIINKKRKNKSLFNI